ncbi:hypothetical protein [Vibrio sp. Hal054]|uniref:hypothetical protein n=1 Tax=Vibrio sp. Hal054 TaxID=3035158 RepID=UPI00301D87A5
MSQAHPLPSNLVVKHSQAGYRLGFQQVRNSSGNAFAVAQQLNKLGVEFSIDNKMLGFTFVRILDGKYKGLYDVEFDFKTSELILLQEKH